MQIVSGTYWDTGERTKNQDSIAIQQVLTRKGRICMAIVCDGIGGLREGETASGLAVEKMTQNFYRQIIPLFCKKRRTADIRRSLLRCLHTMQKELAEYADQKKIQLGTTLSAVIIMKSRFLLVHIGDSRVYRYRKGSSELLTKDHTLGGHRLSKCISSFTYDTPDFYSGKLKPEDALLLCTDGFYRKLPNSYTGAVPEGIREEYQVERRLREVASYVKASGETDNISAVYLLMKKKGADWK